MDKEIGFLIVHGFAGSLHDIKPLKEFLSDKGFTTVCVELKGHTGRRKDLANVNYSDWISSAEESLYELSKQCKKIIIIGFSMGGLIAINLALKHKIAGIVTLCTPIYHWDKKRIVLNLVKDFKTKSFKHLRHYVRAAVRIPFTAMINFKVLLFKTKPLLRLVSCPIFVAQGMLDDTVHFRSADHIYFNVSSKEKEIKYYKNSNHMICHSDDRDEVFNDILVFINKKITYES